jgi:hypothetical protein
MGNTGQHTLTIPWDQFLMGDVLIPRDLQSLGGQLIAALGSYFTHAGFNWAPDRVLDSVPTSQVPLPSDACALPGGVDFRSQSDWETMELVSNSAHYDDSQYGAGAAVYARDHYRYLPYNICFGALWEGDLNSGKWVTNRFYCSQLVWRGYYEKGMDLDSNVTPLTNAVSPDDLYWSDNLSPGWMSNYDMTCTDPAYPWKGKYYVTANFTGESYTFCDTNIDFDWGEGKPTPAMPSNDNFSVRWTATANLPSGNYRFHLAGDDGIRLWIDDDLIIDEWHDQSMTEYTAVRYVNGGNHSLRVDYYEHGWDARVSFWWEPAPTNRSFLPLIIKDATGGVSVPSSLPTPVLIPYL